MAGARLEILRSMVERNPRDSFSRYGLAMEHRNAGDLEAAVREFQALMAADPGYTATYYHLGQTLERLGRPDEARASYRMGIETAARQGNEHARAELQAALDLLA
jgi:tetratricopeptide (TPR) repeat protein